MPRIPRRTPKHGEPAMGNFNDGFRNLLIVVCTPGGIFAMDMDPPTAMPTEARGARHG